MGNFLRKRSLNETLLFIKTVSSTCASLGGPLSKSLNNLLQDGDYLGVANHKISYTNEDLSLEDIRYSRQIKALVEKQDFLNLGVDPLLQGLKSFCDAEAICAETNHRLATSNPPSVEAYRVIQLSKKIIADILGNVPSLDQMDFFFGSGAVTSVKMSQACVKTKLASRLTCSDDFLPTVGEFLSEFPNWVSHKAVSKSDDFETVPVDISVGKLSFVPKNSKTHRPIVVEPLLNALMQKGIGSYLKKRLLRFGVDLYDQSRNQNLALKGSIDGSLATIDLSSASDMVSIGLVLSLLPPHWVDFLAQCRTGKVKYNGHIHELHKFSSMGNGYTFELESLIFFGLSYSSSVLSSCSAVNVSVYGDDIIVPSPAYPLLKEVLSYLGFSVNPEKSFHEGRFRESCGSDWLNGSDIRPFYVRQRLSVQSLYVMHNWMVRHCERVLADTVLSFIHTHDRLWGPDGYGDGHLVGTFSLSRPRAVRRHQYGGGFFRAHQLKKVSFNRSFDSDWLIPSYAAYGQLSKDNPYDPSVVRGSRGSRIISVYTFASTVFRRY